jgi:predicted GIY-YIG superfamily endonuclease
MKRRWHVYILRCRDGSLYTGITTDVKERLRKHNAGTGAKYTRSRRPVVVVWSAVASSESAARKREAEIKGWKRAEKKGFILQERRRRG